jgi:hypothetical protein
MRTFVLGKLHSQFYEFGRNKMGIEDHTLTDELGLVRTREDHMCADMSEIAAFRSAS